MYVIIDRVVMNYAVMLLSLQKQIMTMQEQTVAAVCSVFITHAASWCFSGTALSSLHSTIPSLTTLHAMGPMQQFH